jgi:hypothetical protein
MAVTYQTKPVYPSATRYGLSPTITAAANLQHGSPTGRGYMPTLIEEHHKPSGRLMVCWQRFVWCLYCFITGQWSDISSTVAPPPWPMKTMPLVHEVQAQHPQFSGWSLSTQHDFLILFEREKTKRHAETERQETERQKHAKEQETERQKHAKEQEQETERMKMKMKIDAIKEAAQNEHWNSQELAAALNQLDQ